ncbi:MAG: PhnD/SsuA/transferrin family substrate-binding protein [Rhodocyclaceae bacterium]|nr:PhnD/SsuA/transferrin family substrate-binding protein [Rhodocyclaceae bacterium]
MQTTPRWTRRGFLAAALSASAAGLLPAAASARGKPVFAIVPYLPPRRLVELYSPLLPVFGAALGQAVDIVSAPDYAQHLSRVRGGAYDIVADSLILARIAQREHGHVPIARTLAPLEPLLVVPVASAMIGLHDIKGRAVVVTDRTAALSVIGLRHLRDRNLVPGGDFRIVVSGSHANSLHRLLAGEAAAAIVSRTTLTQVDAGLAAKVRVLATLPPGLSAVVYHVAPRLAAQAPALSSALIDFAGQPAGQAFVAALGHQGLVPVTAAEMQALDPLVVELYRQQRDTE